LEAETGISNAEKELLKIEVAALMKTLDAATKQCKRIAKALDSM
jgi:hypothetical protein